MQQDQVIYYLAVLHYAEFIKIENRAEIISLSTRIQYFFLFVPFNIVECGELTVALSLHNTNSAQGVSMYSLWLVVNTNNSTKILTFL